MTHALKTWPEFFKSIMDGSKTFETRKADRDFKTGDKLLLQEFEPEDDRYTGQEWEGTITYIMGDPEYVKKGWVIFGIKEKEPND